MTRTDVARLAGVSTATVSYVLNNTNKVPERTARRVWDAVEQLKYRPNLIARSLATDRTRQLAIVINNMANPIYSDLILGFENEAIANGYFVNICTGNQNVDDYFDNFAARRIDGLFIEALPFKYHVEKLSELLASGMKLVVFGNIGVNRKEVSSIETDYLDAMGQAVGHLVGLGHSRIAYVSGLARSHTLDRRIEGFRLAMRERLGAASPIVVAPSRNSPTNIEDGVRLTERLLAGGEPFTAVICTNDLMAVGALQALRTAGRGVPADVSVVGIDNAYVTTLCSPTLTTVGSDYRSLGSRAFCMLHADLTDGTKGFYLNTASLVVRESSAPPA